MNAKKEVKEEKKAKQQEFKLPRYLRIDKGSMFFDDQGEDASGVRIYAIKQAFIGRETKVEKYINEKNEIKHKLISSDVPKDQYDNKNLTDYGKINVELPWYIDTTTIDPSKLSRILVAYKYGILVEADPENPPAPPVKEEGIKDFGFKDNGDRIFTGKNKEMYAKLQNLTFPKLRDFINGSPLTAAARSNLQDMYEYELKGYNPLSRARFEVTELLKKKLKEYGPGISSIRVNED